METRTKVTINREYKSTMFTMIFSEKERLLELYNAISGKHYEDPEKLTINTIKNAIYMTYHNDISFMIDSRISLYEHQSTYNPNMPLRFAIYFGEMLAALTKNENLYGSRLILLPTPKFVVFYNGTTDRPDYEQIKLSASYQVQDDDISMELKVDMYNINVGHNEELLRTCKTLGDYAEYVYRVRCYAKDMPTELAVDRAIEECIRENILREFLQTQKAEARTMSIYEYDQEAHMRMEREEWFERGRQSAEKEMKEVQMEIARLLEENERLKKAVKVGNNQ